jgi:hypothetical protein
MMTVNDEASDCINIGFFFNTEVLIDSSGNNSLIISQFQTLSLKIVPVMSKIECGHTAGTLTTPNWNTYLLLFFSVVIFEILQTSLDLMFFYC